MAKQTTSTDLVPIQRLTAELEVATNLYGPAALASATAAAKCFQLAEGVRLTRELVKQALPYVTHLKGTRLGFLTDRDPGKTDKPPYPDSVIVECLTEALLKGARWTDNEINILFGSVHYTLAYWRRTVAELEGVTDLNISPGLPKMFDGGATVAIGARFDLNGRPVELKREFTVRLTSGMGADGAIGKATRRMLAAVHHRATGSQQSEQTASGADEPSEILSRKDALVNKLVEKREARQVEIETAKNERTEQPAREQSDAEPFGTGDPGLETDLFRNEQTKSH